MPHQTATTVEVTSPSPARPWMQYWPPKETADSKSDLSSGQVEGFKAGQRVLLGGVAGNFDTVLYDTASKQ